MSDYYGVPAIVDVEASGFGAHSYPIELGVALANGQRLSMLIKPEPEWTHWDNQAESVHGLSQDMLHQHGHSARRVAQTFNSLMHGLTAYSDAWVVDQPWINKLFYCAGTAMNFSVSPIEQIMQEAQFVVWDDTKQALIHELGCSRHRASQDALLIQQTFIRTREAVTRVAC